MKITKRYNSSRINFHLLPDQMERVKSSVEAFLDAQNEMNVSLEMEFSLNTISQTAETNDSAEFRDIVRDLSEPILALDAQVTYLTHLRWDSSEGWATRPPAFKFTYRSDYIEIQLARNSADKIRNSFSEIEEAFSLETMKPKVLEEQERIRKRTTFLAHNFDERGKSYAYEMIKFLNLLSFEVSTGEGYSPESISNKVRRRLSSQEIVVVIDTTWTIQEAAGATFSGKPMIMLVEEGIEPKPGIHGDLEFIRFKQGNISATFTPILEGLQELGYGFK